MAGTMLDVDSALPKLEKYKTTEEKLTAIQDYLFLLLETLKYKLRNLTPGENFNQTETVQWLNQNLINFETNPEMIALLAQLISGMIEVETPQVVTNNIYAEFGAIADLIVYHLRTDMARALNYVHEDVSPIDYLDIHDEQISFMTATVSSTEPIQYTALGEPLYWQGQPGESAITRVPTANPVMVYQYTELVKARFQFEVDGQGNKYPVLTFGAGDMAGNNIARMYKSTDGLHLDYKNSGGTVDSISHLESENFWRLNGYGISAVDELPETPIQNVIYFTPEG